MQHSLGRGGHQFVSYAVTISGKSNWFAALGVFFLYLLSDRFNLIRTLHRTPGVVLWQLLAAELLLSSSK